MPVLTVNTNITLSDDADKLMHELSALCADMLGKPESYVMVHLNPEQHLIFAGSDAPAAFCSLTSLGMSNSNTATYSARLCHFLQAELGIPPERIYIEFKAPDRTMFGWNNTTF
jgi:phenylpyruvate tautomerase PptA (4-oxalocrotonate tautomerase family)